MPGFSGFILGLENHRAEIAKDHRRRHTACCRRKAAGENADAATGATTKVELTDSISAN